MRILTPMYALGLMDTPNDGSRNTRWGAGWLARELRADSASEPHHMASSVRHSLRDAPYTAAAAAAAPRPRRRRTARWRARWRSAPSRC
jgi:hypothetical protein